MGLLNDFATRGLNAVGVSTDAKVQPPSPFGEDFAEGMFIVEIKDGREMIEDRIHLLGEMMPHDSLNFGGEQRIVKEYYPGNSEPSVQVMGPREKNVNIRGRFKTKHIRDADLIATAWASKESIAQEFQELVDAMRLRGNLVKITLGNWYRYGFIESCDFKLRRLSDIEYDISFSIVGFNLPTNCKVMRSSDNNVIKPNKALTNKANEYYATHQLYPASMPQSISELLNGYISDVATSIALVTNFVDGALTDVENLEASANRALGLIKNANAMISKTKRRLGAISSNISNLGSSFSSEAGKTSAAIKNLSHINSIKTDYTSLAGFLAALRVQFAAIAKTVPLVRHLVQDGDTLQRLAIRYYGSADNWNSIYKHNKLSSTDLAVGSVLEIPKL